MRTDHIQNRNMWLQVLLFVVTLGIYSIYWYYVTLKELHIANGKDEGAGLWTILAIIPIAGFFAQWHHSAEFARFGNDKYQKLLMFILWLVFAPAVWFIVQYELNKIATGDQPTQGAVAA